MTEQQPSGHVRAVLIPVDPAEPVTVGTVDASPAGRCAAVGGAQPEAMALDNRGTAMFVDGYGKAKRLPRNARATHLVDTLRPGFALSDFVAGPALFVGSDPETGAPADVCDDVVRSVPTN